MLRALLRTLALPILILGPALPAAWQQDNRSCRTDYVIRAVIDGEAKQLDGEATVTWTNNTEDTVSELFFHLYHNAFSNNRSTHMSEPSRRRRTAPRPEDYGWQRITSIAVGEADLLPSLAYETPTPESDGTFAPDDEDRAISADDRSVFKVDLAAPVGPGETIGEMSTIVTTEMQNRTRWDTPTAGASSAGKHLSKNSVGHLGFTGTSLWIALEQEAVIVMLTNRVHLVAKRSRFELRARIHDLIMEAFLAG